MTVETQCAISVLNHIRDWCRSLLNFHEVHSDVRSYYIIFGTEKRVLQLVATSHVLHGSPEVPTVAVPTINIQIITIQRQEL